MKHPVCYRFFSLVLSLILIMGLLPTSIAESMDQPAVTPNPQYQEVVLPDGLADFWDDEYIAESDPSSEDESDSIYWDREVVATPHPQLYDIVLPELSLHRKDYRTNEEKVILAVPAAQSDSAEASAKTD